MIQQLMQQGKFRAVIDRTYTLDRVDPTWPAFYLPFQDITTNNHIAQWTTKVVEIIE